MRRKKTDDTESKVRTIVREELRGIRASVDLDPVFTASTIIDKMTELLDSSHDDVDLGELRENLKRLKCVLPDIIEEMNIVRDTFSGSLG